MTARPWLRHPPAVIRRPLHCPTTGLARFANRWLALAAIPVGRDAGLTPTDCAACRGVHLTEGDTR